VTQVVPIRVLLAGVGGMLRASNPPAATVDAGRRASKPPATVDAGRLFVAGVRRLVYERSRRALNALLELVEPRPADADAIDDAIQQAESLAADLTPVTDLSVTQSRLRVLSAPPHAPTRVLCPAGAAG
jgi:hypothetical protein